ncbi:MAG: 3-isopropylmalate dehydratase large subunit [Candidatus Thermoplasmatota archaeon]|nr:3-isopropylmalate dehydratase large subunit [Candidatus Thermoplasmatota archaeon]
MGRTIIEKIISLRSGKEVKPGDIVDVSIDVRVARDFGGANVVKNILDAGLSVDAPSLTFFTFDCNPGGSDQKYAANQQFCRQFARDHGIRVYDIDMGIGTHIAIDEGLVRPGDTFVSTDSHANIMGAIGAFGQGMGDIDIAAAFSSGKVWFKVPGSLKIVLRGIPSRDATAKDVALKMLEDLGAHGLLGYCAELYGEYIDGLGLAGRMTIASMCTEMGGIIIIIPPNDAVMHELGIEGGEIVTADRDACYDRVLEMDISGLSPMVSRPGHPEDVVTVEEVKGTKIDSAFIGSCTNGRYEDIKAAADILRGRKVAPGVVLKVVPSTRKVWEKCLDEGIIKTLMDSGALVGNAGCAGCAAGQIGQNGPGEVTVSAGNRNFTGKQGKGSVYLASTETVAASALAGYLTTKTDIPSEPVVFPKGKGFPSVKASCKDVKMVERMVLRGKVWYIPRDNIDTDMIFHNRYLTITDVNEMGQYTFDNLQGFEDFARRAGTGDIVVVGKNFGAGSSRQQAVECFRSLGISVILAESFGAIYERNAINTGMPIMVFDPVEGGFEDGDELEVDLIHGRISNISKGVDMKGEPFSDVQLEIYKRGGLLVRPC